MKMKKSIMTLFCLALTLAGFAQFKYEITGNMKSMPNDKVTVSLYYLSSTGQFVNDTSVVKDGKFSFVGEVDRITPAFLAITDGEDNLSAALVRGVNNPASGKIVQNGIILENGKITAVLDHEKQLDAVITGTPNNVAFQEFRPLINKYKALEASISAKNKAASDKPEQRSLFLKEYNEMIANRAMDIGALIKKYPESVAAIDVLGRWVNPTETLVEAKKCFAYLSAEHQNSPAGRRYLARIKKAETVELGAFAPDFSMPDAEGKVRKLSDFKGKYILLDFWASWSQPYRRETPNLISTYGKYRDKNFEIISVSVDGDKSDSREKWLEAIKQDKMNWVQLSDLKGSKSNIMSVYAISGIPMNLLIDPNGKIIAKNLLGKDLDNMLKKLL